MRGDNEQVEAADDDVEPFFMNGERVAEDVRSVGQGTSELVTRPLRALPDEANFVLGG